MKTSNTICLIFAIATITLLTSCHEDWYDDGYYTTTSTYTETYYEDEEVYYEDEEDDEYGDDMETLPDFEKGSGRSFFGSYELHSYDSTCDDDGYYDPDLNLPDSIDVYEYGNMMDFENMYGDLLWNSDVSSDYEFSFFTHFYDWDNDPTIDFPCDCGFVNVGESDEYFECACDPGNTNETCMMYYDLM